MAVGGAWLVALVACGGDDAVLPGPPGGGAGGSGGGGGGSPPSCQAGSVVGPDGVCMEVGIQGCAEVFIDPDDGLCHPALDKCPAGTIAKFDEGCVPVGIQGCPEVFIDSDDGLCHPSMDKCPAGSFAAPLLGCVPIDGEEGCGTGTWGHIPDEPDTVWVDPTHQGGTGTQAEPLSTIAEALAVVVDGGRIALAAGTYAEPVTLEQSVELVGRCPSLVTISGTQPTSLGKIPGCNYCGDQGEAIIVVQGGVTAAVRNLRLSGAGYGVIAAGATVTLTGLHIEETTGAGIIARDGADVTIERCLVERTQPVTATSVGGDGLGVATGAQVSLQHSALFQSSHVGTYAINAGSALGAVGVLVEDTFATASNADHGYGIVTISGAAADVQSSAIVRNRSAGVYAHDADLELADSLVAQSLQRQTDNSLGAGVLAQDQAMASVSGCAIVQSSTAGFEVATGGILEAQGNLVADTMPAGGPPGKGVSLGEGTTGTLADNTIVRSECAGIAAWGATSVVIEANLVEDNGRSEVVHYWSDEAVGIGAYGLTAAVIRDNAVVGNRGKGIWLAASTGSVDSNLVEGTGSTNNESFAGGVGVMVHGTDDSVLTLDGNAIVRNHTYGLHVLGAADGATVAAQRLLLADTQPRETDGERGLGVFVEAEASLSLDQVVIARNHLAGLLAHNAQLSMSGSRVTDTREGVFTELMCIGHCLWNKQTTYHGIADGVLAVAATLDLDRVTVAGCPRAGVLYHGSDGQLTNVLSTANGIGFAVQQSPQPVVDDSCQFAGNIEQDELADSDLDVPNGNTEVPEQ